MCIRDRYTSKQIVLTVKCGNTVYSSDMREVVTIRSQLLNTNGLIIAISMFSASSFIVLSHNTKASLNSQANGNSFLTNPQEFSSSLQLVGHYYPKLVYGSQLQRDKVCCRCNASMHSNFISFS